MPAGHEVIDARGMYVVPGFIDLHVHGAGGVMFGRARSPSDMLGARRAIARSGTTAFLATIGSLGVCGLEGFLSGIKACLSGDALTPDEGSRLLGIYLEGPFVSSERAGVGKAWQAPMNIPVSREAVRQLMDAARGSIRIVTIAPEIDGAEAVIREFLQHGVIVAVGHSDATYEQTLQAIEWGATHATHVYNAMRPLHHREPGIIGATLCADCVVAEVIADGRHVHRAAIDMLIRSKPREKVVVVTDGTGFGGMPDGIYRHQGDNVDIVVDKGLAKLRDGTIAGSVTPMNMQLGYMVQVLGLPVAHALELVTTNPARHLGLSDVGSIRPGNQADIVLLDDQFRVRHVFIRGCREWSCDESSVFSGAS